MVEETTAAAASSSSQHDKYGVGASWPMTQHKETAFSESRTQAYETFMEGCFGSSDHHRQYEEACQQWESDRLSMNTRQPMLSQNYTHAGYAKVSTPPLVQDLLQHVWKEHREDDTTTESWERPNTYLNHWESPTQMLDISRYLSPTQQGQLIAAVQSVLEAWTQESLVLTSLYGIRIYQRGAILAPHVDRLPLVTSAILQVDQSVDTDWPLEVIGRDGMAVNLTSLPGEMILYESHSTIHGRPFALQGDYYANVFLHFEPVGHSMRHAQQFSTPSSSSEQAAASYERALAYQQEQQQRNKKKEEEDHDSSPGSSPTLPHYISPDKEARWRQQFEFEKEPEVSELRLLCLAFVIVVSTPVFRRNHWRQRNEIAYPSFMCLLVP